MKDIISYFAILLLVAIMVLGVKAIKLWDTTLIQAEMIENLTVRKNIAEGIEFQKYGLLFKPYKGKRCYIVSYMDNNNHLVGIEK